jgi:succinoglycan biosynthesis protein ExoA
MSIDGVWSVLVVIPTLNEAAHIEHVVETLARGWNPRHEVRVVVVDGGSTDGTVETVHRLAASRTWLSLLPNPQRIQSAAVNLAARRLGSGTDVLVRCDAHADYPDGFVRALVETLERAQADAVVVPMDSHGRTCVQRAVAWVSDTPLGSGGSAHRGGRRSGFIDHGHHAAFRMESFRRAGGYDETFTHNEDAELDCRQRALGSRIYLDADIRIGYSPRDTLRGLWRQYFGYGKGRARTVRKHPGSMRPRQLAVPVFLSANVLALAASYWLPWLLVLPAAYGLAVLAVSVAIALKQHSLCGLWSGPAAVTMHAAWAAGFLWSMAFLRQSPWSTSHATPLVLEERQIRTEP